jgi:hypothetical protein
MTSQPQLTDNIAINELSFLENHINSLIERIKHNGEYAETKKEKAQVITEVQILERLLEYAAERKKILMMAQGKNV